MLVKVKRRSETKYINVSTAADAKDVLHFICSKFDIPYNNTIKLLDRDKVPVDETQLMDTINQFASCSYFFLELFDTGVVEKNVIAEVPSSNLQAIGKEEGDGGYIIEEYNLRKTLNDSSRRILVREAVNFLRKNSGNYPTGEQKIALAKAIVDNFPFYKCSTSKIGGIGLFYNPANNSGYLVSKFKNINRKRRRNLNESLNESNAEGPNSISEQFDISYFQTCVVDGNSEEIEQKLKSTLSERVQYCTNHLDVLKAFPIFRFDPSLISFDFELRYNRTIANSLITSGRNYIERDGWKRCNTRLVYRN